MYCDYDLPLCVTFLPSFVIKAVYFCCNGYLCNIRKKVRWLLLLLALFMARFHWFLLCISQYDLILFWGSEHWRFDRTQCPCLYSIPSLIICFAIKNHILLYHLLFCFTPWHYTYALAHHPLSYTMI